MMTILLDNPYQYLDVFFLVFVRVLSMMVIIPFLGNRTIPNTAKVALAFFLSLIMINLLPNLSTDVSSRYPVTFAVAVGREFLVGWLLGFAVYMAFSILTLSGQFIDYQIGFSMVNVFDPLSQTQFTITGNFYYFVLLMIVLMSRSYYFFFSGLKESYRLIPLGQIQLTNYLYDSFILFFTDFLLISLQIALPIFFVILITNAVLGILARTTPQLNMFVIGFPVKILLGLLMLFVMFFMFDQISDWVIDRSRNLFWDFMKGMSG